MTNKLKEILFSVYLPLRHFHVSLIYFICVMNSAPDQLTPYLFRDCHHFILSILQAYYNRFETL